jgi:2-iminoacetate synthase
MKHIDEKRINELLGAKEPSAETVEAILQKSLALKRLSLEETAALISCADEGLTAKIFSTAKKVKETVYGNRMVLFAPLYITSSCVNDCSYCAFKKSNKAVVRKTLSVKEVAAETEYLLKIGHKRILLVAGEHLNDDMAAARYYAEAVKAVYSARYGNNAVKRANINCAPLSVEGFKVLKQAGIGTFQIFQETYHDKTYRAVHPSGPKSNPDKRIEAVENAFKAGIDDVGLGALLGLYDWRFETLAMLMHAEALEKQFNVGPHTLSVPRMEPAEGLNIDDSRKKKLSDNEFKKLVAILRLSVPYTGIILSTRESAEMRNELFQLGVSQLSAASNTTPGGYGEQDNSGKAAQFNISDNRSLESIMDVLLKDGFTPSFCAACYRKERTGEKFMALAKPGNIKHMCGINAMLTLKEYIQDFGSADIKARSEALIKVQTTHLTAGEQTLLKKMFKEIEAGKRDLFV